MLECVTSGRAQPGTNQLLNVSEKVINELAETH
jgi:hypothetical protein